MAFNWTCPHCATPQTVVDKKRFVKSISVGLEDQAEGDLLARVLAVGCSNDECRATTVHLEVAEATYNGNYWAISEDGARYFDQFVYPQGTSKPQPSFIPQPLRDDYREACLIRDLSPKAAATLVRRCLQGMIRDFAGISKATLFAEIEALKKAVDDRTAPETITHDHIEAIDAVRGIGNIGAHMEKDINIIVDVDTGEAQALIELVEMLFDEWYMSRHKRQQRLEQIQQMAEAKKIAIEAQKELRAAGDTDGEAAI